MGEKKKRVTKLDRLRNKLALFESMAISKQESAARDGEYTEAITHRDYAEKFKECFSICNERPRNG